LAEEMGITVAQLALAWVLRWPEISSAITGATKPQHVQANVVAAGIRLSNDVLAEIEQILENGPKRS
jgi:aryl-alcohol dehydrogenase-like predicted oxidoreductase